MKVGLTYDLRQDYLPLGYNEDDLAEFDSPEVIEGLETALGQLGFQTERIGHIRRLVELLAAGRTWDLVFNIAEGLSGFGREAQIPALLEAYHIPYTFSDPLTLAVTLHKAMAKRIVRDHGLPTPDFVLIESPDDLGSVDLPFPLFAKPVAEGTGKGVTLLSKMESRADLWQADRLLSKYQQPVLVETFLPGREFTVGVAGTGRDAHVLGLMEIILGERAEQDVYSYHNKENWKKLVTYKPADDLEAQKAARLALASYRVLGCRDAGRVDLRSDAAGNPCFMEINPLAGLHPTHSDLPILCAMHGIDYRDLIGRIMVSALKRINNPAPVHKAAAGLYSPTALAG